MSKRLNSTWMLGSLGAANEAILRAASSRQLHQTLCDAVI